VELSKQLSPDRILIAPDVANRDELFDLFGEVFERSGLVAKGTEVSQRLRDREDVLSTGIGGGWAIPHAQVPGIGRLAMAASTHHQPIDYPALDNDPVKLVFCLLGDTQTTADHLAGLARLARLARRAEVLPRLMDAPTGKGFIAVLRNIEEG